jgi:predicted metal-dependent hydrolase
VGGRVYQVNIARHRRARRYLLRVSPDGSLRLTVPRGAAIADGLQFAASQSDWIERERIRQRRCMAPWRAGSPVWFRGREVRLEVGYGVVTCGDETIRLKRADGDLRTTVEGHLMAIASRELPARLLELAATHGLKVARATVRNQKSRWGSCHHAELAADSNAPAGRGVRPPARAHAPSPAEPLAPVLARGRTRLPDVARARAVAQEARARDSVGLELKSWDLRLPSRCTTRASSRARSKVLLEQRAELP